jgi:hypothetical protein
MQGTTGAFTAVWLFLFVLTVLWFLLPFAIFGIKPKLDAVIVEMRVTNKLLKELTAQNRVLVEQQKLLMPRLGKALPGPDGEMKLSSA